MFLLFVETFESENLRLTIAVVTLRIWNKVIDVGAHFDNRIFAVVNVYIFSFED